MTQQRTERRVPWVLVVFIVALIIVAVFMVRKCPKPVPAHTDPPSYGAQHEN